MPLKMAKKLNVKTSCQGCDVEYDQTKIVVSSDFSSHEKVHNFCASLLVVPHLGDIKNQNLEKI